ncbi:LytR/AlgR family response regulator transcription factor [Spirosoma aerolatum]|uniref:LytR/AlgR family response regulator transcription factor n=1 Tax=Spirosoma aerolatum TaxID=1211326 RepID=UPI0009AD8474|nr:LytTR family DNA-binding domain-containing protein [Spirosoma aerolatum]
MKINTLVVDDDAIWKKVITKFVQMNPLLELVGVCSSAIEAYAKLAQVEVDVLICDIELPDMSGLSLIRSLPRPPLVIFVTSYRHYALDCYEVSPVDFLLKPLELDRFLQSIEKVRQRLLVAPETSTIAPYFFVREALNYVQIAYDDVLYMKAQENFLQIVTSTQTFLPILSITKMEEQLKGDVFLRVHRSYLVHRGAIASIGKNELTLRDGQVIPIGDQYRAQLNRKHIEGRLISRG